MRMIEEYDLDMGQNSIAMPHGAVLMSVGARGTGACLWMLVDTEQLDELRHFAVYGTGTELPGSFVSEDQRMGREGERRLGSVLCGQPTDPMNLVAWHVFERRA